MRRFLGPGLVGLGVFLIVLGVLARFYAYPNLAVAPIDQNSVTELEGSDVTLFDTGTLQEITTDLTVSNRTVGDVAASEDAAQSDGQDVRVWAATTSYRSADGTVRSRSAERAAFGATDGAAVNCCDSFSETTDGEREDVKRTGQLYKFPFATEKKDYDFWDSSLGAAAKADYQEETAIDGLTVYRFLVDIPRTVTGTREVPASVVGESGTGNVEAETTYQNRRTLWVEPVTGAIINRSDETSSTLAIDDEDRLTTTAGTIHYTDAQVKANVDDFSTKASQLSLVKTTVPLVGVILGLLLAALGVLLSRRSSGGGSRRGSKAEGRSA